MWEAALEILKTKYPKARMPWLVDERTDEKEFVVCFILEEYPLALAAYYSPKKRLNAGVERITAGSAEDLAYILYTFARSYELDF